MGPLEIIWPQAPAQGGPSRAGCQGVFPDELWVVQATCSSAQSPSQWNMFSGETCFHSKTCFQVFRRTLPQFVPVSSDLILSLGITGKRLALSVCFTPSVGVIVQINRQLLQSLFLGLQAQLVCRQCWLMSYWVLYSAAAGTDHPRWTVVQKERGNILYGTFG